MNIIVTGAAGFIGSHTVDCLLMERHTVVGLDNLRTGRLENLNDAFQSPKFCLEQMDITERGRLDGIVGKVKPQAIIHLAALVSVQESIADPELNQLLNVEATRFVAEAAAAHRVSRTVFASSAAVYGDSADERLKESSGKNPLSPYGSAKLESENILLDFARKKNLTSICFRYFNVYGRRQDPASPYSGVISIFQRQFSACQPVTIFGDGEQTRDFVHVSDVARANVLAATVPETRSIVANICTGRQTSLNRLVEIFRGRYPEAPSAKYAAERPGDIRHSCGDPSLAHAQFGFCASIPIHEGLLEFTAEPALCIAEK